MPDHSPISNLSAALTHVMLGALVGGAYALSFLPWDFVAGSGVFWDSAVSDRATAMVGYRYFFADAWRWPLLAIGTLNVPDGSSVIFTDSIPIVAFLMKVLRTLGMTSVNYFGAWVLLCFAAVGAAMALVVWTAGVRSYAVTAMAALLASASPVLAHRWFHFSLCGQFVILLGIAAYLAADGVRRPQFLLTATAALVAVAIMVNPYLGAMVLGLYLATLVQSVRGALPAVGALIHLGATVGALAALVYAMGYIGHDGRSLAAAIGRRIELRTTSGALLRLLSRWEPPGLWEPGLYRVPVADRSFRAVAPARVAIAAITQRVVQQWTGGNAR
jgi:hypothetical protein